MIALNQITCGDSYELIKEIPDKSIDLIYTDIPYKVENHGRGGCYGAKNEKYHTEYGKFADGIDFAILDEFCRVLKSLNLYIWCSKMQIYPLLQYFVGEKDCRFEILTWHKTNPIPTVNNKYLSDTEYCLFFRKAKALFGSFETKSKYYISPINVSDKDKFDHPTIKPLKFVENHIINSTSKGDVVADFFCGSGTTCVAAKNLGRNFIGIEINPKWAKVAEDRLHNTLANGQQTFFYIIRKKRTILSAFLL